MRSSKTAPAPQADTGDPLQPVTPDDLMRRANAESEARYHAIRGEPSATALTPLRAETAITEIIDHRSAARADTLSSDTAALNEGVTIAEAAPPDTDPRIIQRQAIDAIASMIAERLATIRRIFNSERTARAVLNAWRDTNRVARPAQYPESRLVHFRWLIAFILLEAALTSGMYLPATPDGIAGAMLLGTGVALITTALGVAFGLGPLRYINARATWQRTLAFLATPVFLGLIIGVCAAAAHYRQLAGLRNDAPADSEILAHLLAAPFDVGLSGMVLGLIALACAAFATWKGYTASDPIPGYEAVDRAARNASADLDYLHSDIRAGLAAIRESTVLPLLGRPLAIHAQTERYRAQIVALDHKRARFASINRQEAAAAERAIAQFRALNLATRADGIVPPVFATPPRIIQRDLPPADDFAARIEAIARKGEADAALAVDLGLHLTRLLDQVIDTVDQIVAGIGEATPSADQQQNAALRSSLETLAGAPPCTAPQIAAKPSPSLLGQAS